MWPEQNKVEISTLADLGKASNAENPVNIAGYGRESTHKGYLTWILNSERWSSAGEALVALCRAARAGELGEVRELYTVWEHKLGRRRKIDLLSRSSDGAFGVPIELKTDAGPSGADQLKQLSEGNVVAGVPIPCRLLLLLGSASVQDFDHGDFFPLRHRDIVGALWPLYAGARQFVRDWLDAVRMEVARQDLALDVYRVWTHDHGRRDEYWDGLGYRSKDHLMFYVLDHIRDALKQRDRQACWTIHSGGYNTVLNLKKKGDSWVDLRGLDGARAFFEFNDDSFVLKVESKGRNPDSLKKLFAVVRGRAQTQEPTPDRGRKRNLFAATWLKVLSWTLDLSDPNAVAAQVEEIVSVFGPRGLLGAYV